MTPLQRSATRLARHDRRALHRRARAAERHRLRQLAQDTRPPRCLEHAMTAVWIVSSIVLLGLASRSLHLLAHVLQ